MGRKRLLGAGLLLTGTGLLLILLAWSGLLRSRSEGPAVGTAVAAGGSGSAVPPTRTPEPLIPTRTPTRTQGPLAPTHTPTVGPDVTSPGVTPSPVVASAVPDTPLSLPTALVPPTSLSTALWRGRPRWGVGVAVGPISRYDVGPLRLGWYLDWTARSAPPRPGDVEFAQVILVRGGLLHPDGATIAAIAHANPGSLWLVGNEPDIEWQGNADAATYARLYHEAYVLLKEADPTAQVAVGAVSQPTPLRLRYLDAVLAAYREQFGVDVPLDVWNVHNFILREERGSWGVGIPPGMADESGMLYTVDDSGNLALFRQQIVAFRQWMAARGYQNYPLIVSEYGIPMPADYGFPPQRVASFLAGTFDFFLTAADPATGYPADGYRLVQRWCWYSLADTTYPTGNLFDPQTAAMTLVGERWTAYVEGR